MNLLTRYSLINLLVLVVVFLVSSVVLYLFTKVILIREMDGDLTGIEENVKIYVSRYNKLPQAYSLDEERIKFTGKGQQKTGRTFELVHCTVTGKRKCTISGSRIFRCGSTINGIT